MLMKPSAGWVTRICTCGWEPIHWFTGSTTRPVRCSCAHNLLLIFSVVKWHIRFTGFQFLFIFVMFSSLVLVYYVKWFVVDCNCVVLQMDPQLELYRKELVVESGRKLDKARMIRFDERTGYFASTDLGRTASHFYIKYNTMEVRCVRMYRASHWLHAVFHSQRKHDG